MVTFSKIPVNGSFRKYFAYGKSSGFVAGSSLSNRTNHLSIVLLEIMIE
jgi:hypothetical protein